MDLIGVRLRAYRGPPTLWSNVFDRIRCAAFPDAVPLLVIEILPGFLY
jgi:hypothetical protein